MSKFVMVYLGGKPPASEAEDQKHFAEYMEWIKSMGEKAVSPMNPFKNTQSVSPEGVVSSGSNSKMSGYTIIQANSMDEALELAKSCPFLKINGTLEVSELVEMPG